MPFNGSGVFNRLYSWVADRNNDIDILASRVDNEDNGFANGLTNCITKDGQSTPTADIGLGGFKIKNIANATLATDAVNAGQIQGGLLTYYADTGAADVYVITPSPAISSYVAGQTWRVKITNANLTTTPTLNVNGLGTKVIKLSDGSGPVANTIVAGGIYEVTYDGTNMQIINTGTGATAGNFTTITASSNATIGGTLGVTGLSTLPTVTISGGTINNTSVGATTKSTGGFTSLNTTGLGGGASVVFADTANAGGSNIQLSGNGGTTPNKFIRAASGVLDFLSSAYSVIFSLSDAGGISAITSININAATGSTGTGNINITGNYLINGAALNVIPVGVATTLSGSNTVLTVDFTTYSEYMLEFVAASTAGSDDFKIEASSDAGGSYAASTYNLNLVTGTTVTNLTTKLTNAAPPTNFHAIVRLVQGSTSIPIKMFVPNAAGGLVAGTFNMFGTISSALSAAANRIKISSVAGQTISGTVILTPIIKR